MEIKKKELCLTLTDLKNFKEKFNESNFNLVKTAKIKVGDICLVEQNDGTCVIDFCKKIVSMEELEITDVLDDVFIGVFGSCVGLKNAQKIKVK